MRLLLLVLIIFCVSVLAYAAERDEPSKSRGFLDNPPIYISNQWDIPLDLLDADMPAPGQVFPYFDFSGVSSDHFNKNGVNVQPGLDLTINEIRVSALYGFKGGWAAGASLPWRETVIRGTIGGLPATADAKGIAQLSFYGKKTLWKPAPNTHMVFTAGIELPNGHSTYHFRENNAVTNGYYRNHPQLIPIGWQPDTGTTNGYLGLAYRRQMHRFAYEGLLAAKLYSSGVEDSKVGDIFTATAAGTYGISKRVAFALALSLRSQSDDSFPQAPIPVESPLLAGTTTHGTMLLLNPSIRFTIFGKMVIGGEYTVPIVKPDNGMVPTAYLSIIFSPNI